MEPNTGHRESVVSRLFGFGRKKEEPKQPEGDPAPAGSENSDESGFARSDSGSTATGEAAGDRIEARIDNSEEPKVTIPEQVIRIRTNPMKRKDEMVSAIGDSFKELTNMLGNVSDRLDRQDTRSADLTDQLRELPEYLRSLPRLQEEQNEALRGIGDNVAEGTRAMTNALEKLPEMQERQAHALTSLGDRIAESTEVVHGVSDSLARIPEEMRERARAQEAAVRESAAEQSEAIRESATKQSDAIREVASSQEKMAKVVYTGQQKSMQLFQQATNKTIQTVQNQARQQQQQMEGMIQASVDSMRKMFVFSIVIVGVAIAGVVAFFLFK